MGETTKIAWTDATFNPWWGCEKVSPACAHCYAETFAKRTGHDVFGAGKSRRVFGKKHWDEPLKWDRAAEKAGRRVRVFCGSMCDVFELRGDLCEEQTALVDLILATPSLDWLLLTKRPENIQSVLGMFPTLPRNIWLGVTAEDQAHLEQRWEILANEPAVVRFISHEPALGPLDFSRFGTLPDWVITGGESGPNARPYDLDWARSLRDQCHERRVAFFMKQTGARSMIDGGRIIRWKDRAGADPSEWPEDLRVRQFPVARQ